MSQPYIGEIRIFAGNYAPQGWALCHGQLLAIAEYDTLFALIGTTYGGDGQSTFALPDLRGRVPIHQGSGGGQTYQIGEAGGVEQVTLTTVQMPNHSHGVLGTTAPGNQVGPTNAVPAAVASASAQPYATGSDPDTTFPAGTLGAVGGNQSHNNMPPVLGLNFIISLFGIFPSQS